MPIPSKSLTVTCHLNSSVQSQIRLWKTPWPLPTATITNAKPFVDGFDGSELARWATKSWRIWLSEQTTNYEIAFPSSWANIRRFDSEIERMRVCEILRCIPTRQIETGLRGGPGPNNRYYKQHLYCALLQRKLFSTLWQLCRSPFFFFNY